MVTLIPNYQNNNGKIKKMQVQQKDQKYLRKLKVKSNYNKKLK
jgi:hypothetical protein